MKVCGYNVLPIVTDQLNLYNVLWQGMAGRCGARSGMEGYGEARANNSRLSILKSAPSSVRHDKAWHGAAKRGTARHGRELEIVDRVLVTVPLRVFRHGQAGRGRARLGTARRGTARRGLDWFGVG